MTRSTGRRKVATLVAAMAGLALLAAGCSGGSGGDGGDGGGSNGGGGGGGGEGATLNIWAGSQTPIKANFNPYIPGFLHATQGPIYEPLFIFNKAASTDPTPMLGESYEFSEDGTQMTITTREGVTWSDGEAFTAEDVVYSLTNEAAKADYVASAEATDDTTVVVTFTGPAFTNEASVLQTTILPEHIWGEKTLDELISWTNEEPVGTGPYLAGNVSDAAYSLTANEDYWGGAPAVKNLRYLGIDANASAEDLLKAGQIDWTAMFVPDPTGIPMGYVNTPIDPTVLYTCSNADLGCVGAQTDVAVRQALNLAIDRGVIKEKAFVGLTKEISPTFALLGRDDAWIADGMPAEAPQAADPAAAAEILEAAGYAKGSDGIYAKDGQRVSMKITSVDGWSDYNDAAKLIEEQAKAAGIEVIASTVSWNEFSDSRQSGNYELTMGGMIGTAVADPFQIYRDWFTTDMTQPVGTQLDAGAWGIARYSNPEVDAAVLAASQTADEAERLAQYAVIQEHIVNDLPYIPLVVNATQTFFNDTNFTGWPTEDDLYAFPPAWGSNSAGYILSQLEPVG